MPSDRAARTAMTHARASRRRLARLFPAQHEAMKVLRLLHLTVARAFNGWALREIDPLHPDLPRLVLRRMELADRARREFA